MRATAGEDAQRQAAAFEHLLGEIGLSPERGEPWNLATFEQLSDRTPTQAWLAGDHDGVRALVRDWYVASEAAGRKAASDPTTMTMLRLRLRQLDELEERGRSLLGGRSSAEDRAAAKPEGKAALGEWNHREHPPLKVSLAVDLWVGSLANPGWKGPSVPFPELSVPQYEVRVAGDAGLRGRGGLLP